MSAFPELLGFKELNKDVSPSEAAAFIERMQKEACDSCSEEKKDLLEKMAESLRDLGGNGKKKEENQGEGEPKRTVFADDDDDEDEEKNNESGDSESDSD